jgi:4-amino-4-deoxy-L-arabinose transferase-like glycosyltransferase
MSRTRWQLPALIGVLLLASFLRLYGLDSIPPGVTHDEADTGYFVSAVYRGEPSAVEAPYGYANEPFTMVSGALFMALAGPTDLALRLHSGFFGLLMLVFAYLWLRIAFDPTVALVATALTATSFWTIATSRFALNPQPAPALFAGAIWFLWLAWYGPQDGRRRWPAAILAGLLLAGSLWAYEVARATAAGIVALLLWLALVDRPRLHQGGQPLAFALLLGFGLAAPHLLDPAAWQRSGTLATTWRALLAGDPGPLLATTSQGLGILFVRGDPFVTYNLPGRPLMNPLLGALFVGGLALCLRRWRRPAVALSLLWLAFGLGPVILVGAYTATLHAMGIQPIVYLFPALAAVEGGRWLARRYGRGPGWLAGALVAVLIVVVASLTFRDYFIRWGRSPATAAAYFHDLAAAVDYVQASSPPGVVTLSTPFPDLPHDPYVADLRVHRSDLVLRWVDGRDALIFPPGDPGDQLLLVLDRAPLLAGLNTSGLREIDRGDGFTVYRWDPATAWRSEQDGEGYQPLTADFGGGLSLVGSRFSVAQAAGDTLAVATFWQVVDAASLQPANPAAYGPQAAIFVHLVDAAGQIVAQDDRLGVPAWNWQAGDRFLQSHRLSLPANLAPGAYRLLVGAYTLPGVERLVLATGGDSWELGVVEVAAP